MSPPFAPPSTPPTLTLNVAATLVEFTGLRAVPPPISVVKRQDRRPRRARAGLSSVCKSLSVTASLQLDYCRHRQAGASRHASRPAFVAWARDSAAAVDIETGPRGAATAAGAGIAEAHDSLSPSCVPGRQVNVEVRLVEEIHRLSGGWRIFCGVSENTVLLLASVNSRLPELAFSVIGPHARGDSCSPSPCTSRSFLRRSRYDRSDVGGIAIVASAYPTDPRSPIVNFGLHRCCKFYHDIPIVAFALPCWSNSCKPLRSVCAPTSFWCP